VENGASGEGFDAGLSLLQIYLLFFGLLRFMKGCHRTHRRAATAASDG
jgi:hypothetical protein